MNSMMKKRLMRQMSGILVRYCGWLMLILLVAVPVHAQKKIESDVVIRARPYEQFMTSAAARYGIDPLLLCVVGYLETRFNPAAVSRRGARGMMQFMPATAARYGLSDPHDPQAAIDASARYLRDLAIRFDQRADLVLAAYNSGEATVDAYLKGRTVIAGSRIINPKGVITGGVPPYRETRAYVARGMAMLKTLRSNSALFTQQNRLLINSDSGRKGKNEPMRGLVHSSLRVISHSEPDDAQIGVRPNAHRRSIYFGSGRDEE